MLEIHRKPNMNPKSRFVPLEGSRIMLRLLSRDDLSTTLAWRNQQEIRKWFFQSERISDETHRAWFEDYLLKENDAVYIIVEKIRSIPVGQISVYHIDFETRRAEFGRLMIGASEARGKGLAKEATKLLVEFAVNVLQLLEIYLEVYSDNSPAIAIYESCGFVEKKGTGRVTSMVLRSGDFDDR